MVKDLNTLDYLTKTSELAFRELQLLQGEVSRRDTIISMKDRQILVLRNAAMDCEMTINTAHGDIRRIRQDLKEMTTQRNAAFGISGALLILLILL